MRIKKIEIKNYRSLKEIVLEDLKSVNVFIGKNGSGKSNILESIELFFNDLNLSQQTEKAFEENFWFDRYQNVPINFKFFIDLTEKQIEEVFSQSILDSISPKGNYKLKSRQIIIEREISANRWNNKNIAIGDWVLVKDNNALTTCPANAFIDKQPDLESKQKIESAVDDMMVDAVRNKKNTEQTSENFDIAPAAVSEILQKLTNTIKGKYKLIQTTRESGDRTTPGARPFLVDTETRNFLINIGQNPAREESQQWSAYKRGFKDFSTYSLEMRGGAIHAEMDDLYLPLNLLGGGDQEIIILQKLFSDKGIIFGVEEPETHLHSEYQRKLFNSIKSISKRSQFFITTHSPIFIDRIDFEHSAIWLVRKDGKSTVAESILKKDDGKFKEILIELGIRMSDIFYAEKLLFVEGNTEKELIPIIAKKMDFDLSKHAIEIIAMRGKDTGKYHIKMWYHLGKNTNLPMFFIFDQDGKKEVDDCLQQNYLTEDNHLLLREKDIEDYYPEDILKKAIAKLYSIKKLDEIDLTKPRKEKLETLFKKNQVDPWKVDLGKEVIMNLDQHETKKVFNEFRKFFDFFL